MGMKHCLVVDDSRVIRKVACRILGDLRFQTDEAEDGIVALQACRARMPDIIFLDENMPNMSGMEFLRNFKRDYPDNHPIVVFCTTENDPIHIAEALNAGASDFLVKPYDRRLVEAKLSEAGLV
jgi:two-component system chemotaxis response regulator CheY